MLNFEVVWYADENRFLARKKTKVYEDIGNLSFDPINNTIFFIGKTNSFSGSVFSVDLVRQKLAWKSFLRYNLVLIAFLLALKNTWIYVAAILVIGNILGISLSYLTRWCSIKLVTDNNVLKEVYFLDGRAAGYSGFFGGTKKMYNSLKKQWKKAHNVLENTESC